MATFAVGVALIAKSVQAIGDVATTSRAAVSALAATVAAEGPAMVATLARTAAAAVKVGQGLVDANAVWEKSQIEMLEKLRILIIPFEGSDAGSKYSFDKIIEDQIAKVKAGDETIAQAIQELQRQFSSVYGTLQTKFFGSQDPGTQEFLLLIEQFILSGKLQ